jgi:hypothetical protein
LPEAPLGQIAIARLDVETDNTSKIFEKSGESLVRVV